MLFVHVECLVCSSFPQLSPVFQVAVIPFEIDVPWYVNLDDYAVPRILLFPVFFVLPVLPGLVSVTSDVVFEQPDVIFANGRRKQLAEICQGIMKVFWFADLL